MAALVLLSSVIPVLASGPPAWYEVKGTYVREDNSRDHTGALSLMYLDNDVVMFELFMTKEEEVEAGAGNFCLSGAFYTDESGMGIYEHPKTGDVKLTFELKEGGVCVKQTGKLPVAVGGEYLYVERSIKVTEAAAVEILEQLPAAATSLNHSYGDYRLTMSDEMVDGWFYDVKANFADTGSLLSEFYIAGDMSAVYRTDTEAGTPILIWGTAQPMLDAAYWADERAVLGTTKDESSGASPLISEESKPLKVPYVSVSLTADTLAMGESLPLTITVPGALNYSLGAQSSNPEIVTVGDGGLITAISEGEAIISGRLAVEDGEKPFEFTVNVYDEKSVLTDALPAVGGPPLPYAVPAGIAGVVAAILAGLIVLFALKKKARRIR